MSLILQKDDDKCMYITDYFNHEKQKKDQFRCLEERINNEYCLFHTHISSLNSDNKRKVIERINEKIKEGIQNHTSILLIGYNIPEILYQAPFSNEMYLPHLNEKQHSPPDLSIPIYFSRSKFHGRIVITNYHFKAVYFDDCTFSSSVIFSASLFEKASFKNCIFNEITNFSLLRTLDMDLSDSQFKNSAKFTGAIFLNSNFNGVIFEKYSNFASVIYNGKVFFNSTKFFNDTTFTGSVFKGNVIFLYTKFYEEANFKDTSFINRTNLHNVLFIKQELVFFDSDLSKVSFKNTNITRVVFGDTVTWNKNNKIIDERELEWTSTPIFSVTKNNRLFRKDTLEEFLKFQGFLNIDMNYEFEGHLRDNKFEIEIIRIDNYDMKRINEGTISFPDEYHAILSFFHPYNSYTFRKKSHDDWTEYYSQMIDIGPILTTYRNLRENYEFNLRYNEAGKFFIREMDLYKNYNIDKSRDNSPLKRNNLITERFSATGLYFLLSKYGESVRRPSIFGIIILVGSIIFFGSLPDSFEKISLDSLDTLKNMNLNNLGNSTNLDQAIQRAWEDFIPLFPVNKDIEFGLVDLAIKVLGGILTFGFIIIALKRRFERKHRH